MKQRSLDSIYVPLKITFGLVPLLAGLDKFFNLLADWQSYLSPQLASLLPFSATTFMMIVGVIEIAAGILVAAMPRIGGWVVAAWLWGIIANLVMMESYYDVALRDFGLSLGAIALARLAMHFDGVKHVEA